MEKIEAIINVVTYKKINTILTATVLLIIGFVIGFMMVKLA